MIDLKAQNLPQIKSSKPFCIGKTITIHSKILNEDRILNIYLPNSYNPDSVKTYPVIYLLDGSRDEDFIHISGLVQFGSFSWINMIPETIVVGIANIDRKRDFTFKTWKDFYHYLFIKYSDGNIKTPRKVPEGYKYVTPNLKQPGYSKDWYRLIIEKTGDQFKVK